MERLGQFPGDEEKIAKIKALFNSFNGDFDDNVASFLLSLPFAVRMREMARLANKVAVESMKDDSVAVALCSWMNDPNDNHSKPQLALQGISILFGYYKKRDSVHAETLVQNGLLVGFHKFPITSVSFKLSVDALVRRMDGSAFIEILRNTNLRKLRATLQKCAALRRTDVLDTMLPDLPQWLGNPGKILASELLHATSPQTFAILFPQYVTCPNIVWTSCFKFHQTNLLETYEKELKEASFQDRHKVHATWQKNISRVDSAQVLRAMVPHKLRLLSEYPPLKYVGDTINGPSEEEKTDPKVWKLKSDSVSFRGFPSSIVLAFLEKDLRSELAPNILHDVISYKTEDPVVGKFLCAALDNITPLVLHSPVDSDEARIAYWHVFDLAILPDVKLKRWNNKLVQQYVTSFFSFLDKMRIPAEEADKVVNPLLGQQITDKICDHVEKWHKFVMTLMRNVIGGVTALNSASTDAQISRVNFLIDRLFEVNAYVVPILKSYSKFFKDKEKHWIFYFSRMSEISKLDSKFKGRKQSREMLKSRQVAEFQKFKDEDVISFNEVKRGNFIKFFSRDDFNTIIQQIQEKRKELEPRSDKVYFENKVNELDSLLATLLRNIDTIPDLSSENKDALYRASVQEYFAVMNLQKKRKRFTEHETLRKLDSITSIPIDYIPSTVIEDVKKEITEMLETETYSDIYRCTSSLWMTIYTQLYVSEAALTVQGREMLASHADLESPEIFSYYVKKLKNSSSETKLSTIKAMFTHASSVGTLVRVLRNAKRFTANKDAFASMGVLINVIENYCEKNVRRENLRSFLIAYGEMIELGLKNRWLSGFYCERVVRSAFQAFFAEEEVEEILQSNLVECIKFYFHFGKGLFVDAHTRIHFRLVNLLNMTSVYGSTETKIPQPERMRRLLVLTNLILSELQSEYPDFNVTDPSWFVQMCDLVRFAGPVVHEVALLKDFLRHLVEKCGDVPLGELERDFDWLVCIINENKYDKGKLPEEILDLKQKLVLAIIQKMNGLKNGVFNIYILSGNKNYTSRRIDVWSVFYKWPLKNAKKQDKQTRGLLKAQAASTLIRSAKICACIEPVFSYILSEREDLLMDVVDYLGVSDRESEEKGTNSGFLSFEFSYGSSFLPVILSRDMEALSCSLQQKLKPLFLKGALSLMDSVSSIDALSLMPITTANDMEKIWQDLEEFDQSHRSIVVKARQAIAGIMNDIGDANAAFDFFLSDKFDNLEYRPILLTGLHECMEYLSQKELLAKVRERLNTMDRSKANVATLKITVQILGTIFTPESVQLLIQEWKKWKSYHHDVIIEIYRHLLKNLLVADMQTPILDAFAELACWDVLGTLNYETWKKLEYIQAVMTNISNRCSSVNAVTSMSLHVSEGGCLVSRDPEEIPKEVVSVYFERVVEPIIVRQLDLAGSKMVESHPEKSRISAVDFGNIVAILSLEEWAHCLEPKKLFLLAVTASKIVFEESLNLISASDNLIAGGLATSLSKLTQKTPKDERTPLVDFVKQLYNKSVYAPKLEDRAKAIKLLVLIHPQIDSECLSETETNIHKHLGEMGVSINSLCPNSGW